MKQLADVALERFGGINLIVHNAGVAPMGSMLRCRVDDWENAIDTNVKGVLSSEDVASCVQFIVNTLDHVEIGELTVHPVKQIL